MLHSPTPCESLKFRQYITTLHFRCTSTNVNWLWIFLKCGVRCVVVIFWSALFENLVRRKPVQPWCACGNALISSTLSHLQFATLWYEATSNYCCRGFPHVRRNDFHIFISIEDFFVPISHNAEAANNLCESRAYTSEHICLRSNVDVIERRHISIQSEHLMQHHIIHGWRKQSEYRVPLKFATLTFSIRMAARMQSTQTHTHRFIDFILTMCSTEKLQVRIIAFHFAQSTPYICLYLFSIEK